MAVLHRLLPTASRAYRPYRFVRALERLREDDPASRGSSSEGASTRLGFAPKPSATTTSSRSIAIATVIRHVREVALVRRPIPTGRAFRRERCRLVIGRARKRVGPDEGLLQLPPRDEASSRRPVRPGGDFFPAAWKRLIETLASAAACSPYSEGRHHRGGAVFLSYGSESQWCTEFGDLATRCPAAAPESSLVVVWRFARRASARSKSSTSAVPTWTAKACGSSNSAGVRSRSRSSIRTSAPRLQHRGTGRSAAVSGR